MFRGVRSGFMLMLTVFLLTLASLTMAQQPEYKDYTDGLDIPDVVAKVNGVSVTSDYVTFKFNRVMSRMEADLSQRPNGQQALQQAMSLHGKKKVIIDVIDKEIIRELMHQQAKKQNMEVDAKLVDKEFDKLKEAYPDEAAFEQAIRGRKLTPQGLKESIKIDYLIQELVRAQIKGKVDVTDDDVKKFYEDNRERFQRPESYRTRHIFFPHFTKEMLDGIPREQWKEKMDAFSLQAKANAEKVLKEIRGGADFGKMAKKYSQDAASAEKGGDLDFIYKGIFDPEFDEAVGKLKPEEISGVVKTQFGYHIIQLLETKPADIAPFEDLQPAIQKQLVIQEGQKHLQAYTDALRAQSNIEMFY